jgi:peptidoglycan/LPS O-acetylase OafA/YrhL
MNPPDVRQSVLDYRPDLDGLRAISCLLVFFYHVHISKAWGGQLPWLEYLQGWIGVYVFFALSGFLITSLLIGEERKNGEIRFGAFFLRREFRIVPAYYATILVYGLLCVTPLASRYADQYNAGFWYWVFYCGDVATKMPAVGTLLGHSWSLAVEQRFYLLWPFLLFAVFRSWNKRLVVFGVALLGVLFLPTDIMNCYLALMLGSGVAILRGYRLGLAILRKTPIAYSAGLVAVTFALTAYRWTFLSAFCVAVALLLYHLSAGESLLKRCLGLKPLAWLGQRSYSFYLLHVICINAALRAFPSKQLAGALTSIAVALVLTVALSALSFNLVEEPFRKLGKYLTSTGRRVAPPAWATVPETQSRAA